MASALIAHRLAILHVIPLRLLQTMNWRRCNCNVCGWSPKVTVGNYVRVLPGLPLSLLVGPAAWPRGLPRRHGNFACNSLLGISNLEFISLELQRFWALLKVHAIELHAKFGEGCVAGVWWGVGARIFSPCSDRSGRECEKVRPAHDKSPKSGVLWPAGRTFSRKHWWRGCAGRTFSRVGPRSRVLGELFRGIPVGGGVLGEFSTGIAR